MLDLRDRGRAAGLTEAAYWASIAVSVLGVAYLVSALLRSSWSSAVLGLVVLVFARAVLWTNVKAREWFTRQATGNDG